MLNAPSRKKSRVKGTKRKIKREKNQILCIFYDSVRFSNFRRFTISVHRIPAGLGECHVQDKTRSAFIEAVYVSVKPVICEIFSLEISIMRAIRFDK